MAIELYDYQLEAVRQLQNGNILCGGVGSGKSRTCLAYYVLRECEGEVKVNGKGQMRPMKKPRDLYIITTAKKRDSLEWDKECSRFTLSHGRPDISLSNVKVTIDSWNNIKKYKDVIGAFFIFDEQRVVGSGAWVKAFLNITRKNRWILATATPGDQWTDYIPVFVANGFYRNKTEFQNKHCVFSRFAKYPKIEKYVGEKYLERYRDQITVYMADQRTTVRHREDIMVDYNKNLYKTVWRERWDPYAEEPIQETGKLCYLLRRVVNSDASRLAKVAEIVSEKKRVIIFYNHTFELEQLRELCESIEIPYAEWNGEKHEDLPTGERWAYLVQYAAGCEGWNCITADTIIFNSQSYSYRQTEQAAGRIDRIDTPYHDLYYYHLRSYAPIDLAIHRALERKQDFNQNKFIRSAT